MKTSIGEKAHLVSPRISRLWETMAENDAWTFGVTRFGDLQVDAVSGDDAMGDLMTHIVSIA